MKTSTLEKAIETIADFLTMNEEFVDRDGVVQTRNTLGFLEAQILNTLCWKADQLHADNYRPTQRNRNGVLITNKNSIPYIEQSLEAVLNKDVGTEIDGNDIEYWMKRLDAQIERAAHAKALLDTACRVYNKRTGAEYAKTDIDKMSRTASAKAADTADEEAKRNAAMHKLEASRKARAAS